MGCCDVSVLRRRQDIKPYVCQKHHGCGLVGMNQSENLDHYNSDGWSDQRSITGRSIDISYLYSYHLLIVVVASWKKW